MRKTHFHLQIIVSLLWENILKNNNCFNNSQLRFLSYWVVWKKYITMAKNVLWTELQPCCFSPLTWWHRDGFCNTDADDLGSHTICIMATKEFLEFSKLSGNDLSTPKLEYGFPGVQPGDFWCLCAPRWAEALEAWCAPPVRIQSCHERCLEYVSLEDLHKYILEEKKD